MTVPLRLSHSIDGHPLEIKKLRGEDPVESIDLSGKWLGPASAVIIGSLIATNTVTKSLKCAPSPEQCLLQLSPPNDGACLLLSPSQVG